jgi:undecaprenyl-diphosphatase
MAVERYFHSLWSIRPLDSLAAGAAVYGLYVCIAIAAVAWIRLRPRGSLLPFLLGAVACTAAVLIAGAVHHEQRPFVVLGFRPLVPHGNDNGFPSDHSAVAAFASTFALFIDPPLGLAATIVTIVLGAARSYCLLHTPADVVAGWLLGSLPALAAGLIWRKRWITVSSPPPSS